MQIKPRERVRISLDWKETDRVPIQIYMTPEINVKLTDYFKGRNVLDVLGVDFRGVGAKWRGKVKEQHGDIYYDMWGVGYRKQNYEFGSYDEACDLSLARIKSMDDFNNYPWPDVDDYDFSTIGEQCNSWEDFAICLG